MARSVAPSQSAKLAPLTRATSWAQICKTEEFRGRWVALDNVRYCPLTSKPVEADVVDVDDDLAALCQRMRDSDRHACSVHLCSPPPAAPSYPRSSRAMH
jgi:hypothetical protein